MVTPDYVQPWWGRVLEKQGIATVFALVLLGGGWKIAEVHLDYIRQQNEQMKLQTELYRQQSDQIRLQTNILSTIAVSSENQESRLEELYDAIKQIPSNK